LNCIMLIDDNRIDNFFHSRIIEKTNAAKKIVAVESAEEALNYLKNISTEKREQPEIIFLDINMPGMNGWEFIEEYKHLDENLRKSMIVVMLTTSENPDDIEQAKAHGILTDFKTKPLTKEMLEEVMDKFHNEKNL
jgi:CheY-like chemotaxis protein